jgi:ABC-type multidrug transport system fused ATPase/permease subunit
VSWRSALLLDIFAELRDLIPLAYHRKAMALFGSMTVGSLLEVLGLGVLIPLVGFVFSRDGGAAGGLLPRLLPGMLEGTAAATAALTFVFLLVFLLKNAYLAVHAWFEATFAFSINSALSEELTRRYLALDYPVISRRPPAELANSVITDVWTLVFSCLLPGLTVISELLFCGAIIVFLLWMEPAVTAWIVALVACASLAFIQLSRRFTADLGSRRQKQETGKTLQLFEVFQGAREILIYGAAQFVQDRFSRTFRDLERVYRDYQLVSTLPKFALEFIVAAVLITITSISVLAGLTTQEVLTRIALFTVAGFRLMVGANRLVASAQAMRFGRASLSRLAVELAEPGPSEGPPLPVGHAWRPSRSVRLNAVSFGYPGAERRLLENVSLVLDIESITGIVGRSGAGKSSFLDLLAGLQRPTSGTVLADGMDIGADVAAWRHSVGYVSQSPILFSDTLRRNIAFGIPDDEIVQDAIVGAVRDAQLEEVIRSLPAGLDTPIGEGGQRLSGGQQQRVAIARALYRRPAVLLLDEPSAALDPATERSLMEMLTRLRPGRIIVLVSHRPQALEFCDRIFRLDGGALLGSPGVQSAAENGAVAGPHGGR